MSKSSKQTKVASGKKCLKWFTFLFILACALSIGIVAAYRHIEPQLPSIESLKKVKYQVPLSVFSQDGNLIAQFGEKKRNPVRIDEIPETLIQAFLSAEDNRYFQHHGVDYKGLIRAAIQLLRTGEKSQGGSTITMQVARNFFLTREKTFMRKFKEILLALKIEKNLNKQEILELYLNKIYLGHRAYGIGAAAQVYYGKNMSDLDLAQCAMIAGLPKAPSRYNPVTNPTRALVRRDYILKRMLTLNFIDEKNFQLASQQPVSAKLHSYAVELQAHYLAEMVRNTMVEQFGDAAYTSGYKVTTTIDSRLQNAARKALRQALHDYDNRHGYHGPEGHVKTVSSETIDTWKTHLGHIPKIGDTIPGIVSAVKENSIEVYTGLPELISIPWDGLKWAREYISENRRGPKLSSAQTIVQIGDIIRLRPTSDSTWVLTQVPKVAAALVSLNPTNGAILALIGGFDFFQSKYNRASQIRRQPGSGFKPVLYTTALEHGFTTASIINDSPVVFDDPSMESEWRPQNYSGKFFGPTRLRVALRNSRNLVSIRLLREVGLEKVINSALRFGFIDQQLPHALSLALGSGTASPLEMARMFAVFANGGFLIDPYFIDRIESIDGELLFQASPKTVCPSCADDINPTENSASRVISPQVHYIMYSLLQDVIRRGTGKRAMQLGRSDLAGKTGTTNEQRDAWFNGFSPSLVAVSWVGFDSSRPLGNLETGGRAALPMWMYFIKEALNDKPERTFKQPDGMTSVRIDPTTGLLALPNNNNAIFEIFRTEFAPTKIEPSRNIDPYNSEEIESSEIESLF